MSSNQFLVWLLLLCTLSVQVQSQERPTRVGLMPDLVNLSKTKALGRLERLGTFDVKELSVVSEKRKGRVVSQSPLAGTSLFRASRVVLRFSAGPTTQREAQPRTLSKEESRGPAWALFALFQLGSIGLVVWGFRLRKSAQKD